MAALLPGPILFALNPGQAVPGLINFTTKEGRAYYNDAVSPLDEDKKFDCTPENLNRFIGLISDRARAYNWTANGGIMQVPPNPANPLVGQLVNLVDHYGERTLEVLRQWEQTYIALPIQNVQDMHMLYNYLLNSITPAGRDKVKIWHDDYHVNGLPSGVLLYKIIMREAHIDTNATATSIQKQMLELDDYMVKCGSEITGFNQHVNELISGLAARGETSNDLLVNLFKAYKAAGDAEFIKYIGKKESHYEDNELNLTVLQLMGYADLKYKILVQKEL